MIELHDYQRTGIERVATHWESGVRSVLAVAPTGAGKGTMAVKLMAEASAAGQRCMYLVHLRDIAEDIAERLRAEGVAVGMILPGHARDPSALVQVASTQSLLGSAMRAYDMLVVDEAHHYAADEWKQVLIATKAKRVVGFTATPERADGKGLGDLFDELVDVVSYSELLRRGHIVPCRLMVPPRRLDGGEIAMPPADAYLKYANGSSAFIYVRSLKRADEVLAKLRKRGVKAALITDKTPHADRTAFVAGLKAGDIKVIVNYATMTEGVDAPIVSTVVLEQPCLHQGAYLQRVGRALRAHPGKAMATVLDLSGASYRHGVPTHDREYALCLDEPIRLPAGLESLRRLRTDDQRVVLDLELVEASADWLASNGGPRVVDWGSIDWSRSDGSIGRSIGLSGAAVGLRRAKLGIEPTFTAVRRGIVWDEQPLGSVPDAELARTLGTSRVTVHEVRKRRGIPVFRAVDVACDARLGTMTDSVLAGILGVAASCVRKHRLAAGFARFMPPSSDGRACPHCGVQLLRRPMETHYLFERRVFCNRGCAARGRRRRIPGSRSGGAK